MKSSFLSFNTGGVCAGHGVCVNSTRTAGSLLCKCDAWYSGASDFFDNRVEQLPDGSWLSFSCNSSDIGTYVVWIIFCLFGVVRAAQLIPSWLFFWKRHFEDPKKRAEGVWRDSPLRVVSIDLLACIPFFITGFCKLAGMTFGTDILPTITFGMAVIIFQFAVFDLSRTEFDIFVQGSSNKEAASKAQKLRLFLKYCGLAVFSGFSVIPALWALSLDKSQGPLVNKEELVIYFRSLGVVAFGLLELFSTWMVRKRVRNLLSFSKNDTSAVSLLISKMDAEMKSYMIFLVTIGSVYSIFLIPQLLAFQTYNIALLVGLGALRHSGKAFVNEKENQARGTSTAVRIDLTLDNPSLGASRNASKADADSTTRSKDLSSARHAAPDGGKQDSSPSSLVRHEDRAITLQDESVSAEENQQDPPV